MKKIVFIFILLPSIVIGQRLTFSLLNGLRQHKEELLQPITYQGYKIGVAANYTKILENKASIFADITVSGIYTAKTKLVEFL